MKYLFIILYLVNAVFCFSASLRVESIQITGATKTHHDVVFRLLDFQAGDSINAAIIANNIAHLQASNFFRQVNIFTRPGGEKGLVIAEIAVKERRYPTLHVEGGYSEFDGWYISPLSVRYDNPFGNGCRFGINSYLGDHLSGLSMSFLGNHLFRSGYCVEAEVYATGHDYIHTFPDRTWQHKVDMGGIRLNVGLTKGLLQNVNFKFERRLVTPAHSALLLETKQTVYDFPPQLSRDTSAVVISDFSVVLFRDSRDNTEYPTGGLWGSISLTSARQRPDDSFQYGKIIADCRFYHKIRKRSVLAVRFKYAGCGPETPFYDRFYLGGAMSVRGYGERRLTPVGWGTKSFLTNVEYRIPLSRNRFPRHRWTAALFFDAGGIWQPQQPVQAQDLYSSWGAGIRVRVPVLGLLRFDFAFPLNKDDAFFHLSLGHTF
ncbi:BamA/TamA family outer membrane protein [candidate division KSB1 bacterium]|nr:BamA/TamA family outer membrane protein [candidate division KSB1 bacterium]